jgi:hypothetical protein
VFGGQDGKFVPVKNAVVAAAIAVVFVGRTF